MKKLINFFSDIFESFRTYRKQEYYKRKQRQILHLEYEIEKCNLEIAFLKADLELLENNEIQKKD